MGNKEKCTEQAVRDAVRLTQAGLNDKDIADYLGVAPDTYRRWKNHPRSEMQRRLNRSLKKADAERKAALLLRIRNASNDSWQAAAWLLERRYPGEYARPVRPMPDDGTAAAIERAAALQVEIVRAARAD